jgi:hypothetical protein
MSERTNGVHACYSNMSESASGGGGYEEGKRREEAGVRAEQDRCVCVCWAEVGVALMDEFVD